MQYVREGIACYKKIREDIREGIPCWPTGLASMSDEYISYGLINGGKQYLAVWRTGGEGEKSFEIPLKGSFSAAAEVSCIFPEKKETVFTVNGNCLTVSLAPKSARLFLIVTETREQSE